MSMPGGALGVPPLQLSDLHPPPPGSRLLRFYPIYLSTGRLIAHDSEAPRLAIEVEELRTSLEWYSKSGVNRVDMPIPVLLQHRIDIGKFTLQMNAESLGLELDNSPGHWARKPDPVPEEEEEASVPKQRHYDLGASSSSGVKACQLIVGILKSGKSFNKEIPSDVADLVADVFNSLQTMSFQSFLEQHQDQIQTNEPFRGASAEGSISMSERYFPCTTLGRTLMDSLIVSVLDKLMHEETWDGSWSLHNILVIGGKCHLIVQKSNPQGVFNPDHSLRALHILRYELINIFAFLGSNFPPFFEYLVELLITPPPDFATNKSARKEYLLAIRNNATFASLPRLFTLLVNFGQICRTLDQKDLKSDFAAVMTKVGSKFGLKRSWIGKALETPLLNKMFDKDDDPSRKRKASNVQRTGKKAKGGNQSVLPICAACCAPCTICPDGNSIQIKSAGAHKSKKGSYKVAEIFSDLIFYLRNFCVHAPEKLKDDNGNLCFEKFEEIIYLIMHFYGDALPKLVEFVIQLLHIPQVLSMWNMYSQH